MAELCGGFHRDGIALGDGASLIAEQTMDLFPHSSPDRSWSWIKDDFRTVPRVHLGLPEGTIGDYTLVWKGADPLTRARFSFLSVAERWRPAWNTFRKHDVLYGLFQRSSERSTSRSPPESQSRLASGMLLPSRFQPAYREGRELLLEYEGRASVPMASHRHGVVEE